MEELIEQLAEHNHEVWSANRIQDGWTWGSTRDDETRTTPCLIPYASLPEGEKEIDRATAREVIKAVIALGFRIEK